MQAKYDRNIEELERARMDEGRYWNPRYSENPQSQFGFQSGFGPMDPSWLLQQRLFQQQPFLGFNQMLPQQYSYFQNIPQQQPFIPQMTLGFGSYPSPFPQPQSVFHSPAGAGFLNPQTMQQVPFQPSALQPSSQIPVGLLPEASTGDYQREYWGQRGSTGRPASRAFHRPPRNYRRSDELIRDEICKRLALTPEVDATDVDVIVRDGEVTLRGNVDDRYEKRLVEDIIESTFGVRDLLNEIRVGSRQHEQEFSGTPTKSKEK